MPVHVSYPGIYLEELPSSARTIVAAPTSVAVFVGYTHPYKTRSFGKPMRLFSFADYERAFGVLLTNPQYGSQELSPDESRAVQRVRRAERIRALGISTNARAQMARKETAAMLNVAAREAAAYKIFRSGE